MNINVTRWTLIVLVVGLIMGAVAVEVLLPLSAGEDAVSDTIIGAAVGAFAAIIGHYFPRG